MLVKFSLPYMDRHVMVSCPGDRQWLSRELSASERIFMKFPLNVMTLEAVSCN